MNRAAACLALVFLASSRQVWASEPIATSTAVPPVAAAVPGAATGEDPAAAALAFAVAHHPELAPLLKRLRQEAPAEFAAAVADLDRTRERLTKLRDRQPERYEAALAEWKLSSRIRLTLARLATNPSAEAEQELRQLVQQRAEARLVPLRAERERISGRLEKITAQLEAFDRDPEAAITAEYEALRAKAAKPGPRSGPSRKPAVQPGGAAAAQPAPPKPDPAAL